MNKSFEHSHEIHLEQSQSPTRGSMTRKKRREEKLDQRILKIKEEEEEEEEKNVQVFFLGKEAACRQCWSKKQW